MRLRRIYHKMVQTTYRLVEKVGQIGSFLSRRYPQPPHLLCTKTCQQQETPLRMTATLLKVFLRTCNRVCTQARFFGTEHPRDFQRSAGDLRLRRQFAVPLELSHCAADGRHHQTFSTFCLCRHGYRWELRQSNQSRSVGFCRQY